MRMVFEIPRACAAGLMALAVAAAGCASDKKAPPEAPTSASLGATNMQAPPRHGPTVPNTPSAANVSISEEILRTCGIPDADAYFAFDSSQLTAFDPKTLDRVADCFAHGPLAGRTLSLVGHADPRGPSDYNVTLGQSRADAVATYLTSHGLARAQTRTTSRGAMDATGTDDTGWAHDRRVDVLLAQ